MALVFQNVRLCVMCVIYKVFMVSSFPLQLIMCLPDANTQSQNSEVLFNYFLFNILLFVLLFRRRENNQGKKVLCKVRQFLLFQFFSPGFFCFFSSDFVPVNRPWLFSGQSSHSLSHFLFNKNLVHFLLEITHLFYRM